MENIHLQDDSGDKKFFTIIPNYILNHSTAIDQALYLNLKRFAGENGSAYPSKRTLMKKLSIGYKALEKSLNYLLEHKWISDNGMVIIRTAGGEQFIKSYKVNDIWVKNNTHFQGVPKRDPLSQGVPKSNKGVLKRNEGVAESNTKKILKKDPKEDRVSKETAEEEVKQMDSLLKKYKPDFIQ